jgi:hypothetical protein
VTAVELYPIAFATTSIGTPDINAQEAKVWRRTWKWYPAASFARFGAS